MEFGSGQVLLVKGNRRLLRLGCSLTARHRQNEGARPVDQRSMRVGFELAHLARSVCSLLVPLGGLPRRRLRLACRGLHRRARRDLASLRLVLSAHKRVVGEQCVRVTLRVLGCVSFELLALRGCQATVAKIVHQAHLRCELRVSHQALHPLVEVGLVRALLLQKRAFNVLLLVEVVVDKHAHLLQVLDLLRVAKRVAFLLLQKVQIVLSRRLVRR